MTAQVAHFSWSVIIKVKSLLIEPILSWYSIIERKHEVKFETFFSGQKNIVKVFLTLKTPLTLKPQK